MNNVDDLVLRENVNSKYRTCSDKEIIEYLVEEIEQYRNRIKNQERIIDNLSKLNESVNISVEEDEDILDDDIEEIITTSQMADGKIVKTITEYKYKD